MSWEPTESELWTAWELWGPAECDSFDEFRVWEGLRLGELGPLTEWLRQDKPLTPSLRAGLLEILGSGTVDKSVRAWGQRHRSEVAENRIARERRNNLIAHWVLIRKHHSSRGSLPRIYKAAAEKFNVSEALAEQCYKKRPRSLREIFDAVLFLRDELEVQFDEMCNEHGLDIEEAREKADSGEKLNLKF